jgi:hypothetical protein
MAHTERKLVERTRVLEGVVGGTLEDAIEVMKVYSCKFPGARLMRRPARYGERGEELVVRWLELETEAEAAERSEREARIAASRAAGE